ncbi:MAG: hypothetical protein IJ501_06440 [Bacilli bacterium]|nr:hypothetical protein [Bacilli bacterium]
MIETPKIEVNNMLEIYNDTHKNLYIINNKPSENLLDCLNKVNSNTLNLLYNTYFDKKVSKDKKIKLLHEKILNSFKYYLNDLDTYHEYVFESDNIFDYILVKFGYMFIFEDNNKEYYIIPKELKKLYKEKYTKEYKKLKREKDISKFITSYLLLNGIIDKDELIKIIKTYHINITYKELDNFIKDNKVKTYNNYLILFEYYLDLIKEKKELDYIILKEFELKEYAMFYLNFLNELKIILKEKYLEFSYKILKTNNNLYRKLDKLIKEYNLESKEKELKDLFYSSIPNLRFWSLNGRTSLEYQDELVINLFTLEEKPSKTDLYSCLSELNEELYSELVYILFDEYIFDKNKVIKEIIQTFKDDVEEDRGILKHLKSYHNEKITKYFDFTSVEFGHAFLYRDNNDIKVLIPNEIMEIINKRSKTS